MSSNINLLVFESLNNNINEGVVGTVGAGLGAMGGYNLRKLGGLAGGAIGSILGGPAGAAAGYSLGAGLTTGGLSLVRNYLDPTTRYDYIGNGIRALGAGFGGSVPFLGNIRAATTGAGIANQLTDQSAAYNRAMMPRY